MWKLSKSFLYKLIARFVESFMYYIPLTISAPNPSIFRVDTVMNANWIGRTVNKSSFTASAAHIVQKDGSSSLAKECTLNGNSTYEEEIWCFCFTITPTAEIFYAINFWARIGIHIYADCSNLTIMIFELFFPLQHVARCTIT